MLRDAYHILNGSNLSHFTLALSHQVSACVFSFTSSSSQAGNADDESAPRTVSGLLAPFLFWHPRDSAFSASELDDLRDQFARLASSSLSTSVFHDNVDGSGSVAAGPCDGCCALINSGSVVDSCARLCGAERANATDVPAAVIGDADFQRFVQQRALQNDSQSERKDASESMQSSPSGVSEERDGISDFIFCLAAVDEPRRGLLEHGMPCLNRRLTHFCLPCQHCVDFFGLCSHAK